MSLNIFSKNLKYLMRKRKLTRPMLADRLKIKPQRLAAWMEARAYPRMEQFIDLCNALDYYDPYRMLTVDLSKDHGTVRPAKLPAHVEDGLKEIIDTAGMLLSRKA